MKVLQINAVYEYGSTGRIVKELDEFLVKSGYESYIAYAESKIHPVNGYKIGNKFDRKLHALYSRIFGKQAYASKRATKKLLKWIDCISPDIVHLHNLHGNYINFKLFCNYLAQRNIPTVITLHDCWFFTGGCSHYVMSSCDKWQKKCGKCPRLKQDIASWFIDKTNEVREDKKELFNNIDNLAVIGVSDWITNEVKKSFLKNAKFIKRIYNWIDLNVFYPRQTSAKEKYQLPQDKFLILFSSAGWNINSDKFSDILELSNKLSDNQQLVLLGNIRGNINLPQNITALGYVNSTDKLAEINSCCDVYVHVSRADTFGKVIAEALSCGTPAIVYNTTACPELIGLNCGYVVETGDVNQIKTYIDKIQVEGKEKYSRFCTDFVRKNFEKAMLCEQTMNIYKELIEEANK